MGAGDYTDVQLICGNYCGVIRRGSARLGEGLTRDKELFQTPVFSSRHRRGWMRGGLTKREPPNKDVHGFVFFNIYLVGFFVFVVFFLQVGEGASKVTATQQVPPDRWQRGGRRSSRQKKQKTNAPTWMELISPSP